MTPSGCDPSGSFTDNSALERMLSMVLDWAAQVVNPTADRGRVLWEDIEGDEPSEERVVVMLYDRHGNSVDLDVDEK